MASFLTLTSIAIALTPKLCPQPHCQPHQDTPVPRHKPDLLQSPQPQLPKKEPCWLFKGESPPLSGVARPGSGGPQVTTAPQRPSRDTQSGGLGLPPLLGLPHSWACPAPGPPRAPGPLASSQPTPVVDLQAGLGCGLSRAPEETPERKQNPRNGFSFPPRAIEVE